MITLQLLGIFFNPCFAQTEQEFILTSAKLNEIRPEGVNISRLTNSENEILIEGTATNSSRIAEFIKSINATNTGKIFIREIIPSDQDNHRIFNFRLAIKSNTESVPAPSAVSLPVSALKESSPEDSIIFPRIKPQTITVDSLSPIYSIDSLLLRAKSIEIKERRFTRSTIASLSDGDLVQAAFSPSGKKLAYAKSIFQKDQEIQELTEISIYDLNTKKSVILLASDESKKFAVYKAFVSGMMWKDQHQLFASISDGDVDSTDVTFDGTSGQIISTEYVEAGLEQETIDKENSLAQKLFEKFPSWNIDVLKNFTRGALFINNRAIVSQRNYHGYNNNVILLDLDHNRAIPLVYMGDGKQYAMAGGFVLPDGSAIFSLRTKEGIGIFRLSTDNAVIPLGFIPSAQNGHAPQLAAKHVANTGAHFLVELNRSYEHGNNPVFFYSNKLGLLRCSDFREIYDIDISKDGETMATIFWNSNRRNISVSHLHKFSAE